MLPSKFPDDEFFMSTLSEMMVEFAEIYNDGFEADDKSIVKGARAFIVFQKDTEKYSFGTSRKPLGLIRIVAERVYGVPSAKTFKLIDEDFCLKFGMNLGGAA